MPLLKQYASIPYLHNWNDTTTTAAAEAVSRAFQTQMANPNALRAKASVFGYLCGSANGEIRDLRPLHSQRGFSVFLRCLTEGLFSVILVENSLYIQALISVAKTWLSAVPQVRWAYLYTLHFFPSIPLSISSVCLLYGPPCS